MKKNKTWFYVILFLMIGIVPVKSIAQTTYTQTVLTPTTNWSCGNENLSPSKINFLNTQNGTFRTNQALLTGTVSFVVPVVVHVLYDASHANDPAHNLSYQQIQWQITALNMGFQKYNYTSMPRATNTQIQFCLAQIPMGPAWTNSVEPGVMRYQVSSSILSHTIDLPGQTNLYNTTHSNPSNFPFQNYLNIWLVDEIVDTAGVGHGGLPNKGVMGYSNFPNTLSATNILDGIVIRNSIFGSNLIPNNQNILFAQLDKGSILTHEAGHYLNMLHTFQGGCVGTNSATCLSQGDLICDTPPSSITNTAVCTNTSSCTDNLPVYSGVDQYDFLNNFMCYADDDCLNAFTSDQSDVMQGVLNTAWPTGRMDMVSSTNLAATGLTGAYGCCPTGVTTAYFTSSPTSCTTVTFNCVIPPCAMNANYQWDFGDGNTLSATTNTASHTYSVAGRYTPTLTVTGGSATATYYRVIEIGTFGKSSAKTVCNNSYQGVNFHVQTSGSSGTYTLGANVNGVISTHTYAYDSYYQYTIGHRGSEDIEWHIPVNLSPTVTLPAQVIYTVTLTGANICSITYIDTFNVTNCCNNIVTNGDFSNGTNGFFNPSNNGNVGNGPLWLTWPFTPSLNFDSPLNCGVPNTCTVVQMYNTIMPTIVGGVDYHLSYQLFGGNPAYMYNSGHVYLMDTLFINPRIIDNSGVVLHDFGNINVMDLVDSTWHHYDFVFTPTTTVTNPHISILQVKNFYSPEMVAVNGPGSAGWGYDYAFDEISVRAVAPTYTVATTPTLSTICPAQSVTVTASTASSYTWSTGANTSSITVAPVTTTVYSVTATSSLNCTASTQMTVSVTPDPTLTASSQTICAGQSVTLTVSSPNSTYTWSPGSAHTSSIVVSPGSTTVYSVSVTNTVSGCVGTRSITITVNPISLTVTPTTATICTGGIATFSASGTTTYSWSTGATTAGINVSPGTNTNYTVTGTNTLTGCSLSKTVSLTVNPTPTITATANPTLICAGLTSTLTATGASTYSWSAGGSTNTITVSPTVTAVYTATGTTALGCSSTKTVMVTVVPNGPVISASNLTINTCSATANTLVASGAATYTWMPGNITTYSAVVTPTAMTIYTVSGEYAMPGCGIGTATLAVNPNTSTLCCSSASISIGTSLTSSVNMAAGNYTVSGTVIDMQGTITFTGNTSFTGYTLRMAPRTKLVVLSDYSLTVTNCKLFSCSELWDGIYFPENTTKVGNFTATNSTIEDMYNGIVMDCNSITIPTGAATLAHITIDQSVLNKNYVSIQLKNASGVNGGAPYDLAITSSTISSNTSTTSPGSTLKPSNTYTYAYKQITNGTMGGSAPYVSFPRAYIGIYLNRLGTTSDVKIGNSSSASYTNTFDNMDFGIYGTDAQIKVKNNYFKNITGSFMSQDIQHGGGYRATGPLEIGVAVLVDHNTANAYDLVVGNGTVVPTTNPYPQGNKFEDCNKGVKSNNAGTTYVSGNLFTSASTDIPVVTTSGSPPVQINNPNTYYYYKAQNAAWYTNFEGSARFYYNYVRNQNVGAYASVSTGTAAEIAVQENDIASPSATGYCKNAILLEQTAGTLLSGSITNNTITNVYNGVTANSLLTGLNVTTNSISIETTAKTYNHGATSRRTGVTLNYCEYANVQGNSITGNGSVPSTSTTAQYLNGVYLVNSKFGKVECNSTTSLGRDFVFEGTCNNSWKVNDMSNSYIGLEIRSNGVIGQQGAASGTPNLSANTWTTITRQTSVISSAGTNTASPLYLQGGGNTEPTLNFSTIAGQSYSNAPGQGIRVSSGTSYTCLGGYSAQRLANNNGSGGKSNRTAENSDSLTLFSSLASNTENAYEVYPEEFVYHNKQMVYKLVRHDSITPIDSSNLFNFYVANQNSAIDHLTQVQDALAINDIANAVIKNASINAIHSVEQKHQRSNELALKYLNDRSYQFTAEERNDLFAMSNECLLKGYYVMQSRNILSLVLNTDIIYGDNCDDRVEASRKSKTNSIQPNTSFVLFPNPNNGTMQLDYDLGNDNTAIMKLFDVAGKLIRSYKLDGTKGSLQMNEQNLYNGVYFYRILVRDKIIKNDKIVIIK